MGDSGDEFDRHTREKFQRERESDNARRNDAHQFDRRAREREWSQRERPRNWVPPAQSPSPMPTSDMKSRIQPMPVAESIPRRRPVDYPPPHPDMKRRFSPDRNADLRDRKRMRPFEPGFDHGAWPGPGWPGARPSFGPRDEWGQGERGHPGDVEQSGPRMMTFKQWLNMQSDDITDEEAVTNYTEYKVNFKRQQLQEFFMAHKNEEWFKEKYHPDEADKRFVDECASIRWRADVFKKLVDLNITEKVSLDLTNENDIVKVLDSAVIFMEGGNEEDLLILNQDAAAIDMQIIEQSNLAVEKDANREDTSTAEPAKHDVMKPEVLTEEQFELKKQAALYMQLVDQKPADGTGSAVTTNGENGEAAQTAAATAKGKHYMGYDDDDEDANSSESDDVSAPPGMDQKEEKRKPSDNGKAVTESDDKHVKGDASSVDGDTNEKASREEGEVASAAKKPRALHRTHSIFMRNLPPSVTKQEIINLCKRFPGFIRVAFSHPLEDRNRFYRRCWVTFDRSVNIKDICWNLNNLRLRDIELNPVVNRDLARRVRPISGISQHATCARSDLRNIARLIMHLDTKWKLWEGKDGDDTPKENPWLKNISEYLVDESNAEEEMLVGEEAEKEEKEEGEEPGETTPVVKISRDQELIQVLDRLLYYLRIVHSVDYYNALEYPSEDEMPNRCGIMHARGPIPPNMLTKSDIQEFQKRFNDKLVTILNFKEKLTEDEAKKLGPKDVETEVEKFVTTNTQELGKDKWLCPLSGKKFKGPDYIRKHIFNKHSEKVEGVRKEVKFFNNYLMDPRRPGPPDPAPMPRGGLPMGPPHPHIPGPFPGGPIGRGFGPPMGTPPAFRGMNWMDAWMKSLESACRVVSNRTGRGGFSTPQFHRPPAPYGGGPGRTYPPKNRPGDPYSSRPIVGYQDLDAPDDVDFF